MNIPIRKLACATLAVGALTMGHAATAPQAATPENPSAASPGAGAAAAPAPSASDEGAPPRSLEPLAWLEGCWQGSVNQREFREVWLPHRGGLMLGVSQMVLQGRTVDFSYSRLEPQTDGVYYVVLTQGRVPSVFKLTSLALDKLNDATTYNFTDPKREFPTRIGYRRASEGWLYLELQGKVKGTDRLVIYPMRRVDCETGEYIRK